MKIGKSWLAYDIALACARGTPAFTKIPTRQCTVLYLALEDPERRVQSRMRKILAGESGPARFRYALAWPSGAACLEALDDFLEQNPDCRLVIVDPFGKVRGEPDGRKGVYQQDYADMAGFHALANRRNICLLLIHHTRKAEASDSMDRISGSTAIQGAPDFLAVLSRDRGGLLGQLSLTGRDVENGGDFAVSFDKATCKWTILGEAQEVKRETEQDKVYRYLLEQAEPVKLSQIVAELGIKKWTVSSILYRLLRKGAVEHAGHDAWQLRQPS